MPFLLYRTPVLNSRENNIQDFWPLFTIPELEYKVLDQNLTIDRALKSDQCYFWDTFLPQMYTMIGKYVKQYSKTAQVALCKILQFAAHGDIIKRPCIEGLCHRKHQCHIKSPPPLNNEN